MILIIVVRWAYPGAVRTSSGAPRTGLVGAIADTSTTPGGERKLWGVFSVLFSSWSSWPPSQSEDSATQSLRTAVLGRRWRWGWGQHANFSIVLSLCLQAPEKCDEVFGCQPEEEECYSINDVDSNIFTPDTRQALKVCGTGDCSEYADRGFACAPIWTCKDNRIITDGKVTSARLSSALKSFFIRESLTWEPVWRRRSRAVAGTRAQSTWRTRNARRLTRFVARGQTTEPSSAS